MKNTFYLLCDKMHRENITITFKLNRKYHLKKIVMLRISFSLEKTLWISSRFYHDPLKSFRNVPLFGISPSPWHSNNFYSNSWTFPLISLTQLQIFLEKPNRTWKYFFILYEKIFFLITLVSERLWESSVGLTDSSF